MFANLLQIQWCSFRCTTRKISARFSRVKSSRFQRFLFYDILQCDGPTQPRFPDPRNSDAVLPPPARQTWGKLFHGSHRSLTFSEPLAFREWPMFGVGYHVTMLPIFMPYRKAVRAFKSQLTAGYRVGRLAFCEHISVTLGCEILVRYIYGWPMNSYIGFMKHS